MKIIGKLKLLLAVIVPSMMVIGAASAMDVPNIKAEKVMSGLENPWDMSFLPDGSMLYTEKCKGLSVRTKGGDVHAIYGVGNSSGYNSKGDDLFCEAQAGMLGVVADPKFKKNRTIYVYSASKKYMGDGCKKDNYASCHGNIVMKFKLAKDMKSVSDRTDIVKDIEYKPFKSDQPFGDPGAHNGGRMRFGPDGFLYVGGGDRHWGPGPQSGKHIAGKVLRIDGNGKAAKGNKPPRGFDKRIYTYGHRNVQGIDFRPSDGRPFTAEHGPWHNDEITGLVNGGNGGWDPHEKRGGRSACPDKYCGYEPNQKEGMDPAVRAAYTPMSDTRFKDLMTPAWNNNGFSQGTGSAAFLKGKNWGIYEGRLAAGIMGIGFGDTPTGLRIDMYDITDDATSIRSVVRMPMGPVDKMSKRYRGLVMGPGNALYACTDEGEVWKITASLK